MSTHTQEPWTIGTGFKCNLILGVDPVGGMEQTVAEVYGYSHDELAANMRRFAAVFRACQGIPTETLEAGVVAVPLVTMQAWWDARTTRLGEPWDTDKRTAFHDAEIALHAVLSRLQQNGGDGR